METLGNLLPVSTAGSHKVKPGRKMRSCLSHLLSSERILVVNTESQDVSIEEVQEEQVDREFPGEYSERQEQAGELRDTSSLLSHQADVFRYFTHRHLRSDISLHVSPSSELI